MSFVRQMLLANGRLRKRGILRQERLPGCVLCVAEETMLLAVVIMFVVAQAPPQRLMRLTVPVYTAGVLLLVTDHIFF